MRRLRRWTAIGVGIAAIAASLAAGGSASADGTRTFKGHSVKALPTFRVALPSTLIWTNSGSFFQISVAGDYRYDGAVTSDASHGATYVPPGLYYGLRVRAIGTWTITIRPGVERLSTPLAFSGTGERELPPFRLTSGKTMYWTNTGERFQTIPWGPGHDGIVSSGLHRGKTHLRAGRHSLVVDAVTQDGPLGNWRIVIR
jgi:hypothetical protein